MSQAPVFSREAFLRQLQQQEMDKMNDPQKRAALQSQFNYINTSMQKTGAPPTDAGMDMQRQYNAPTYAPQASTPPTSRSEAPTYNGAGGLVNRVAGAIGTAGRVMASEQNRMSAPTYGGLDSQPGALAARAALVAANAPVSDAELRAREQAFRARQQQAITTGLPVVWGTRSQRSRRRLGSRQWWRQWPARSERIADVPDAELD